MQNYVTFLHKQAVAAVRELSMNYNYDSINPEEQTLSNSKVLVAQRLKETV